MVREIKIGLLALIVLAGVIIGYQFVKGKNVFKNTKVFHTEFADVDQLEVASPVLINGYKIGSIVDIRLNPDNVKSILVSYEVDGKLPFPTNTIANLESSGLMGGKQLTLSFDAPCSGNCAKDGARIQGNSVGMIESMMGVSSIDNYTSSVKTAVAEAFDTLSMQLADKNSPSPLNKTMWDMQLTMENMSSLAKNMNGLMSSSYSNLKSTIENLSFISASLVENSTQIKSLLSNVESITAELDKANLGNTVAKSNETIEESTKLIKELQKSISKVDETFAKLNGIMDKVDNSDGSLSMLINDKELYSNMEETSKNLSLLLQDMRLNPKRYVRFSVFGRNNKDYEVPEDDPAFKEN